MKNFILASIIATSILAPLSADAAERTRLGTLDCMVEGGIGLLVGSSKSAQCTFKHANGNTEKYTGKISKLGLDIGVTGDSFLKWIVLTPAGTEIGEYALAGRYVGVSAGATLGIGLGANALVGGSAKKIGLQPLSVENSTGLNVAVGVSTLKLDPA